MPEKVTIRFLGTGSAIPTSSRNHTGILLTFKNENILIDCGEGIQRQFKKAKLSPMKLTKILITHWHGDHILGIPGLLQTLALDEYKKTLHIYGPRGTKHFIKALFNAFVFVNKINIKVKEITKKGIFFKNPDFSLQAFPVIHHRIPSNAYIFIRKGQLKIDKTKLKKFKLPSGKHLGKLKQGKDIIYKGKKYKARDLTFIEDSRKISFVLDTKYHKSIEKNVKDSDLLICEASFDSSLAQRARESYHLISAQAAQIAKKANIRKLILTHLSNRYDKNPKKILNEAKKIFKNTSLVNDLDVINI